MAFNIPVSFIFNEVVFGTGHSRNLSVLLHSYSEREIREQRGNVVDDEHLFDESADEDDEHERIDAEPDLHGALKRLLDDINGDVVKLNIEAEVMKLLVELGRDHLPNYTWNLMDKLRNADFDAGDDVVKLNIEAEVKKLLEELDSDHLPDFKHNLMAKLQNAGFDAGLCKTKWENDGHRKAGHHEYIDINSGGTRYIVEVSLCGLFEIARPTESYESLRKELPRVFVGKPNELIKLVTLMCSGIKKSMKRSGMHMGPWRNLCYMKSKWFESYHRTRNVGGSTFYSRDPSWH